MSATTSPRVSILIPNYNNGRQSSRSGDMDLIGNLLQSLWDTLHDDPTPFELLVNDDASTDDSIDTLRAWSKKTWPNGEPLLKLVESPHEGFISRSNNRMYAQARGDIFVRLDGDIVCLTPHWVSRITAIFDQGPPELGIVGPKQLSPDGRIHACGDWLLHPNGYTHIGAGLDRYAIRWPIVCDHNMGCFYCCKRALFDDIGGYDEKCLRGETEDFTLRARLKGWTCLATPEVEFVHYHGMRHQRPSKYDSAEGVRSDLEYFERKWGFNRIAPDLDIVRDRYAGTPLIWNARWFAIKQPADAPDPEPLSIDQSEWGRYQRDTAFQAQVQRRLAATAQLLKQLPTRPTRIVQFDAGSGLLAHLLAKQGIVVTGIERNIPRRDLARRCVAATDYPAGRPTFIHQRDPRLLPLADDEAELVLIFDLLEHDANPMGLLKEARRILQPGGTLMIITPRRQPGDDAPTTHEHRYSWPQLANQLSCGLRLRLLTNDQPNLPDLIAVAQRPPTAPHTTPHNAQQTHHPREPANAT
ncbi:MAG: methyltransferase domain-containing protein [bacterium]